MKPDVEEAIKHAKFVADYYDGWVPETSAAIRTLLDAYASREAEIERLTRERDDAWAAAEAMSADVTDLGAKNATLTAEVGRMREAGAGLANCAYNLAQDERLDPQLQAVLSECCRQWDAALSPEPEAKET